MDNFEESGIYQPDPGEHRETPDTPERKGTLRRVLSYGLTAILSVALTVVVMNFLVIGPMQEQAADETSKLDQLEQVIDTYFIGQADQTDLEDAAAEAMVEAVGDRWSYYVSASDYQAYEESSNNSYVGVGITVSAREDGQGLDILQVEDAGPASEAGILPGDVLTAVDGTSILNMDLDEITAMVRGEEDTDVTLTITRDGEELSFTITRRQFDTVVATGQMLSDGIGLVTIENFNSRCCDETVAAIEELIEQGAESLIFDVRNNPGGYKHELVDLLDYLLPEGDLFISEDYAGNREVDRSDSSCLDMPMMVLVNSESYSAAEFFAAALSEYGVAEIVGTQTCGKGYYQMTIRLSDGSAVNLSVGKYYTPNGVSLAEVGGLTPDYVVEVDDTLFAQIYAGQVAPEDDPQIQKAVELLTAG